MPGEARAGSLVRRHLLQHLAGAPAPEPQVALRVAAAHELAVGGNDGLQGEAADLVSVESLSRMVHDGVHALVHRDLVVERLAENVVAGGVQRHGRHRGHVGFLDVPRGRVVAVVPAEHLAVVRRADELPAVLVEADRVHRRLVVVVRHRALRVTSPRRAHFARSDVELVDARVLRGRQEGVRIGGRPHALEGDRSLGVVPDALPALRVPELDVPVERRGEEGLSVRRERHPANARGVAHVRALDVAPIVHIPDFDLPITPPPQPNLHIHAARQQQMAVGGEELDALHRLGVARPASQSAPARLPLVDHLGGHERPLLVHGVQVRRRDDPRAAQVVLLLLPVERRLGLFDGNAEARRLERVDRRLLVHHVFRRFPGADPLRRIALARPPRALSCPCSAPATRAATPSFRRSLRRSFGPPLRPGSPPKDPSSSGRPMLQVRETEKKWLPFPECSRLRLSSFA